MKNKAIVFVGTYPPRECGIATFTQDLLNNSKNNLGVDIVCKVAAFNMSPMDNYKYPKIVEWVINQNSKKEHLDLARSINNDDSIKGVVLQHEYGIYGGENGKNILYFMESCKKPMLVTLHTILPKPTLSMKAVTERIIRRADSLVVLTESSKKVLENVYPSSAGKVFVIPHGVHPTKFTGTKTAKNKLGLKKYTILSTFGLLSRGKGIEYVIKALPKVVKKNRSILYLIIGMTHPVIRRKEGETYRNELIKMVKKLKLNNHVKFYDQYLGLKELLEFLKATDIYISTSTNPNQAVSGTLSYAMGTGRAVVSTEFAQAKEIVTNETGRLVPIKNSEAISEALNELLKDKKKLIDMHKKAYEVTRPMLWGNVAWQYSKTLMWNYLPELDLTHLEKMTDGTGLIQFAKKDKPDLRSGYTADDNARAMIISSWLCKRGEKKEKMVELYLKFIEGCQLYNGKFINYKSSENKLATDQNKKECLEDASARAMWGLGEVMSNEYLSVEIRDRAKQAFMKGLETTKEFKFPRSMALMIKALVMARGTEDFRKLEHDNIILNYAESLAKLFKKNSVDGWEWYENKLTYSNAILPESLILAGYTLGKKNYIDTGEKSLDFLIKHTFMNNYYSPVGNSKWFEKGGIKSEYDQQPEDPAAMVLALVNAYIVTYKDLYKNLAFRCFSWFLGNNKDNLVIYNYKNGGCFDGLNKKGVNQNQGAESMVMYLMARLAIEEVK